MSEGSTSRKRRCRECDGVQPLDARECEVCGADLDGSPFVEEEVVRIGGTRTTSTERRESAKRRAAAREAPERELLEEKPARPAARIPELGRALARELRLAIGWTILSLGVLGGASLALTFAPPNADAGASLLASWHYLWQPLLIGAAAAWGAGLCYDLVRAVSGLPAWSAGLSYAEVLLGVAVPGIFILSAARSGAVPPSAWPVVPLASAAGFVATLVARMLLDHVGRPDLAKVAVLVVCASVLGAAWLAAPASDIPSRASQKALDRRIDAAVSMPACSPRPISPLPPSLFRNSLIGIVHCHQGRIQGKFLAFRNNLLLSIYASQKEYAAKSRRGGGAEGCNRRSGVYVGGWFDHWDDSYEIGNLYCYGRGRRATIEWQDPRNSMFASVHGTNRKRLYRWWRRHSFSVHFQS